MKLTAKERIDMLPAFQLLELKQVLEPLEHKQRIIEAGIFLCKAGIIHWTGIDSEYLLMKTLNIK